MLKGDNGICYDNEIKEEEITNIFRIEYMHTGNWVMGYDRKIWVLELDEETENVKRSLYYGKPLVPEYSRYNRHENVRLMEGDRIFRNNYYYCDYFDILYELKIWNWSSLKPECTIHDGDIVDIAFFTKDSDGMEKICRYQISENEHASELGSVFDRFFDTMSPDEVEYVNYNREMMEKSDRLLPGNQIQEREKEE